MSAKLFCSPQNIFLVQIFSFTMFALVNIDGATFRWTNVLIVESKKTIFITKTDLIIEKSTNQKTELHLKEVFLLHCYVVQTHPKPKILV